MNISQNTVENLREMFGICFYDAYLNEVDPSEAIELCIGFSKEDLQPIGKSIKATKKETTFDYVLAKLNSDQTFKNFTSKFNSIISKFGLSAYATSYGIGVFVAVGFRNSIAESKQQVENILNDFGIKYSTEYSDAGWVFRYKISKSSENISLIDSVNFDKPIDECKDLGSAELKNELKNKILSFGGNDVKLGLDTKAEQLRMFRDSRLFDEKVNFVSGTQSQCHRNVSDRYSKSANKGFKIASGYALSDGLWIQHSWGINKNGLIETTKEKFDAYYGYELTPEESEEFCFDNY